jgi:hypothetical protein
MASPSDASATTFREDAEKVKNVLSKRFAKYGLTLHPEKTRLLEFGRYAEERAKRQGKKKPGTKSGSLHMLRGKAQFSGGWT